VRLGKWPAFPQYIFFLFSLASINISIFGFSQSDTVQPDLVLKAPIDRQANSQLLSSILNESPPDLDTPSLGAKVTCSVYSQLEEECLDVNREFYNYQRQTLRQRSAIFWFHHTSTIIIFIMVVILVLAGLFFAGVQFHRSFSNVGSVPKRITDSLSNADLAEANGPSIATSTFKLTLQGFEVTTSILGVIILAISMAFFYLYLLHVYPIKEVLQPTAVTEVSTSPRDESNQE